jgi:RNA recognition motif-containing protein
MRSQRLRGNVFVANLPPDLTDDELAEAFDPFGIVLSASIARDPETGKRLRYGFVDIATERAAKFAVEAMNGVAMGDHHLDVRMSEPAAKVKKRPAVRPETRRQTQRATFRRVDNVPDAEAPAAPVVRRRQPTFQVEHRSLPRRV